MDSLVNTWPIHHTSMRSSMSVHHTAACEPEQHSPIGAPSRGGGGARAQEPANRGGARGLLRQHLADTPHLDAKQHVGAPHSSLQTQAALTHWSPRPWGGRGPRTCKRTRGQMESLVKTRPVHHTTPHHSMPHHSTPLHATSVHHRAAACRPERSPGGGVNVHGLGARVVGVDSAKGQGVFFIIRPTLHYTSRCGGELISG